MDEDFDARKKRRALELEAKKKKLEELRRLKKERQQRRSQVRVLPSRAVCWRERYTMYGRTFRLGVPRRWRRFWSDEAAWRGVLVDGAVSIVRSSCSFEG